ncbi:MAG TPA: MASE1 domain-containing protein [Verrucomicrobiae bacterium]|nr:MASE1 domain-containing protein [Verrucomicrobiae bacterium]
MRTLAEAAALAAIYYLSAVLGLNLAIPPGIATAVWPPSGIAFAVLVLRGNRLWPGIWVASFLVNFPSLLHHSPGAHPFAALAVAFAIASGSALQAVTGASLQKLAIRAANPFERVGHVFLFMGVTVIACMVASTIGSISLRSGGFASAENFAVNWQTWWLGDFTGIVVVTPVILSSYKGFFNHRELNVEKTAAALSFFCGMVLLSAVIFSGKQPLFYPYYLFPIMAWCAFHYGQVGVAWTGLVMAGLSLWFAHLGQGPFAIGNGIPQALLISQGFIAAVNMTGMALAAAVSEIQKAHQALRDAYEERKRLAEELDRSNKELEQFASIASHDLRAPMREIAMFTQLIERKLSQVMGQDEKNYLSFIEKSCVRMNELIDSILEHSRVSQAERVLADVDLNVLVREILSDLEMHIREKKARIHVDELPAVLADRGQMRQLLQNLLTNALKYSKSDVPPYIRVSGAVEDDRLVLYVQDNGIGFDAAEQEKVFQPFRRFTSKAEGTGMGLAICKTIVERHGGKITAESRPNEGSTFIVKMPAQGR